MEYCLGSKHSGQLECSSFPGSQLGRLQWECGFQNGFVCISGAGANPALAGAPPRPPRGFFFLSFFSPAYLMIQEGPGMGRAWGEGWR